MTPFNRASRKAFTPILTPFTTVGVDVKALAQSVDRQIVAGMGGIVVCDAYGEDYALSQTERNRVLSLCVERGRNHLTIIAATGTNCTKTTIERCRLAGDAGVDALLVTIPYYSKPTIGA